AARAAGRPRRAPAPRRPGQPPRRQARSQARPRAQAGAIQYDERRYAWEPMEPGLTAQGVRISRTAAACPGYRRAMRTARLRPAHPPPVDTLRFVSTICVAQKKQPREERP